MEHIPEDLKADLTKAPSVDVLLGHTFRVWHEGRSFKDYWVNIMVLGLVIYVYSSSHLELNIVAEAAKSR